VDRLKKPQHPDRIDQGNESFVLFVDRPVGGVGNDAVDGQRTVLANGALCSFVLIGASLAWATDDQSNVLLDQSVKSQQDR
jgi:hypothetical protein